MVLFQTPKVQPKGVMWLRDLDEKRLASEIKTNEPSDSRQMTKEDAPLNKFLRVRFQIRKMVSTYLDVSKFYLATYQNNFSQL